MMGKIFATIVKTQILLPILISTLARVSGESTSFPWRCTSPCQYVSDGDADPSNVPCVITDSCSSGLNRQSVSNELAASAPRDLVLQSSNETAQDGHTYLSISPRWRAPAERIDLLRGFEVKTLCNKSPCVNQQRCVTVTFNRTLTTSDTLSNFSMDCQFWNFSQPQMEYVTIVRSLPQSESGSNLAQNRISLPSCEEVPEVSVCKIDSYEYWEPSFTTELDLTDNRSMKVIIWPARIQGRYPDYSITLVRFNSSTGSAIYTETKTLLMKTAEIPAVYFYNIVAGSYMAWVQITRDYCSSDCRMFQSKIVVVSPKETIRDATTLSTTTDAGKPDPVEKDDLPTPHTGKSVSKRDPNSLSLAALAGALGGCLGIGLLFLIGYLTCIRKWKIISRQKESAENNGAELVDDVDYMNDDDGFFQSIYPHIDNNHSCLLEVNSPSMIPQTIHNDVTKPNGILLQESNHYANILAHGKGDSISTVAVDVHTSHNGWVPATLIPPSYPKFISSPGTLDSGVELASSLETCSTDEGDDETLVLSLALCRGSLGEMV